MANDQTLQFILKTRDESSAVFKAFAREIGLTGDAALKSAIQLDALASAMGRVNNTGNQTSSTSLAKQIENDVKAANSAMSGLVKDQQAILSQVDAATLTAGKKTADAIKKDVAEAALQLSAAGKLSKIEKDVAASASGHANAGATREVLTLFHEISAGRYKNAIGSFTILLNQLGAMEAILTPVGIGLVGVAGGFIAAGVAAIEGANQSAKFNNELLLTNGYLGLTESEFENTAEAIGTAIPGGVLKARNALEVLQSSGKYTSDGLQDIGTAIVELSRHTGESAVAIASSFVKGQESVDKWAFDLTSQYHFLTTADMEYVQQLVEHGQQDQAQVYVSEKLTAQLDQQTQNLGFLARAWHSVGDAANEAWNFMEGFGRNETIDQKISDLQKQLAGLQQRGGIALRGSGLGSNLNDAEKSLQNEIALMEAQKSTQDAAAAAQSKRDQIQQAGNDALQAVTTGADYHKYLGYTEQDDIRQAVQDYKDKFEAILKADPTSKIGLSLEHNLGQYTADEKTKFETQTDRSGIAAAKKQFDTYSSESGSLSESLTPTQSEIDQYQQLGKVMDDSNLALVKMEATQGKLAGLNPAEITSLENLAKQADAAQQHLAAIKELTEKQSETASRYADMAAETQELADQYKFRNLSTNEMDRQVALLELQRQVQEGVVTAQNAAKDRDIINANFDQKGQASADKSPYENFLSKGGLDSTSWETTMIDGLTKSNDLITQLIEGTATFKNGIKDVARSIETDLLGAMEQTVSSSLLKTLFGGGDLFGLNKASPGGGGVTSATGAASPSGGGGGLLGGLIGGAGSLFSSGSEISKFASSAFGIGKDLFSYLGFANGGVMTPYGALPLHKYATGGVATSPQLAVFGEGRSNEAYVPLPDGKTIPVTMRGAGKGGSSNTSVMTNSFNVTVQAGAGGIGDKPGQTSALETGNKIAQAMKQSVVQIMLEQQRVGGALNGALPA